MALTRLASVAAVVLGAVVIAVGIWWIYPPAGLIAFGTESILAGYLLAYFRRAA